MQPLSPNKIKLVNQIDDVTCVPACLSMITGEPIVEVIAFMKKAFDKDPPFSQPEIITYLVNKNYFVQNMTGTPYCHFYEGVYLLSVCSLNFTNLKHQIVITRDESGQMHVFDPQQGRENKEWFVDTDWGDTNEKLNWSEPLMVFDCNVYLGDEDVTL